MCKTEKNVEFLIDNGNHNVIKAILEDITKSERDAKEDHKKMAVHFAA